MIPRVFQPCDLAEGTLLSLKEDTFHHLVHVLRLKAQDPLILFNGKGGEYEAYVSSIQKNHIQIQVTSFQEKKTGATLSIHLGQGIAKGEKMDWIIQKAVELGVTAITPLMTDLGQVHLSGDRLEGKLEHWRKIIIHAAEQCGRCELPDLYPPMTLGNFMQKNSEACHVVLEPTAEDHFSTFSMAPFMQTICLCIGPESGFSDHEIEFAKQHEVCLVHIGKRILRTETAAVVMLALTQFRFGDLHG